MKKIRRGRKTEEDSLQTRQKIIETFLTSSFDKGAHTLTVKDLASEVGVAHGTITYQFLREKETLAEAMFSEVLKRDQDFVENRVRLLRGKGQSPLQAYVTTMFDWLLECPREASFNLYLHYLVSTRMPLDAELREGLEVGIVRTLMLLYEGIGMEIYQKPSDPEAWAKEFHCLLAGALLLSLSFHRGAFRKTVMMYRKLLLGKVELLNTEVP